MSTDAPSALRADACPEPEQLAAFIDGTLTPAERTLVEQHLLTCTDCRDVVATSVGVLDDLKRVPGPSPVPVAAPIWHRVPVKVWAGLGAGLAAAAAITLVVRLQRPSPYYVPEMAELAAVQAPTRPIEPRLTGGFAYAPPPPVTRGSGDTRNLELTATAEKVRSEIEKRAGADADAARGVVSLVAGDTDFAVDVLERATASGLPAARMSSDLAASYLQRGRAGDLERALAAAQRAVDRDPSLREAAFNRALALERLGRTAEALQAWRDYAGRETDAAWAAEAQRHVARLRAP